LPPTRSSCSRLIRPGSVNHRGTEAQRGQRRAAWRRLPSSTRPPAFRSGGPPTSLGLCASVVSCRRRMEPTSDLPFAFGGRPRGAPSASRPRTSSSTRSPASFRPARRARVAPHPQAQRQYSVGGATTGRTRRRARRGARLCGAEGSPGAHQPGLHRPPPGRPDPTGRPSRGRRSRSSRSPATIASCGAARCGATASGCASARSTAIRRCSGTARRVRERGVPNYFGPQRFGRDGANLAAAGELLQGGALEDRFQRGMAISAARAFLFNAVLAQRVAAGTWTRPSPATSCSSTAGARCSASRLPMPMWNRGAFPGHPPDRPPAGSAGEGARARCGSAGARGGLPGVPSRLGGRTGPARRGGGAPGAAADRADLRWALDGDALELAFELPAGGFATTVLARCASRPQRPPTSRRDSST